MHVLAAFIIAVIVWVAVLFGAFLVGDRGWYLGLAIAGPVIVSAIVAVLCVGGELIARRRP